MRSTVIGIAGLIGSGKSSVALNLASRLQCPVASFGGYVRALATNRGQEIRRGNLQELSEQLLASLGAEGLTRNVLAATAWDRKHSLVVDGVRHAAVVAALKAEVAPMPFLLIYLDVTVEVQQHRLVARDNLSAKELHGIELHSTERDVASEVRDLADLIISADGKVVEIVDAVMSAICLESDRS